MQLSRYKHKLKIQSFLLASNNILITNFSVIAKALLTTSENDALALINSRFPIPHFVKTSQGESQSRFLISKLNPSTTHVSSNASPMGLIQGYDQAGMPLMQQGTAVFTDDVSLQVFMEHLKRLAVSSTATSAATAAVS